MTSGLLLVAEDSPAGLAAARYAVELARLLGVRIRAVSVIADGVLTDAVSEASGRPDVGGRRDQAIRSMLGYLVRLARREGVEMETVQLSGEIAGHVLTDARRARPDLIILGRDDGPGLGAPALAPWATRILEFAEQPVIVVPTNWRPHGHRS